MTNNAFRSDEESDLLVRLGYKRRNPVPVREAENLASEEERNEYIKLNVYKLNGLQMLLRVRTETQFYKIKKVFADRSLVPLNKTHFFYNGHRVRDTDTVTSLRMRNNDYVNVVYDAPYTWQTRH